MVAAGALVLLRAGSVDSIVAAGASEVSDPDWLTIREVARRLSVSQWQVRKWIEGGQFDEIVVFSKRLTRISLGSYLRFVEKYPRRVA